MGMTGEDGKQKTMSAFLSLCWNQFTQHHFGKSKHEVVLSHSLMSDSETPWTVMHQALLSMLFSRQEYWIGLPLPPPGYLPHSGIECESLASPVLAGGYFTTEPQGKAPSKKVTSLKLGWQIASQVKSPSWITLRPCFGRDACVTTWSYEPCSEGAPDMDESQWRILTKCSTLEKEMAIYSSILAWKTPQTIWKRQKDMTLEDEPFRLKVSNILLRKSGGQLIITTVQKKQFGQSRNKAKFWMRLVVKVQYCKEQYCIGTSWNVRSMNQGKLEVDKQEMVRLNINILGISELKWMGKGIFNSDDHYIYSFG